MLSIGVLIAGCGGAGHVKRPASAFASAGDGSFQTVVPPGFVNNTGRQSAFRDLYSAGTKSGIGIGVLRFPIPQGLTLNRWAQMQPSAMHRENPLNHDFSKVKSISVGGVSARAVTYLGQRASGQAVVYTQIAVFENGAYYDIAGSAPTALSKQMLSALGQVTSSWRWKGG